MAPPAWAKRDLVLVVPGGGGGGWAGAAPALGAAGFGGESRSAGVSLTRGSSPVFALLYIYFTCSSAFSVFQ